MWAALLTAAPAILGAMSSKTAPAESSSGWMMVGVAAGVGMLVVLLVVIVTGRK